MTTFRARSCPTAFVIGERIIECAAGAKNRQSPNHPLTNPTEKSGLNAAERPTFGHCANDLHQRARKLSGLHLVDQCIGIGATGSAVSRPIAVRCNRTQIG